MNYFEYKTSFGKSSLYLLLLPQCSYLSWQILDLCIAILDANHAPWSLPCGQGDHSRSRSTQRH